MDICNAEAVCCEADHSICEAGSQELREFNAQNLANTAWAFATLKLLDEKLFTVLASQAEQQLSELNAQELANTAWAFATLKLSDE